MYIFVRLKPSLFFDNEQTGVWIKTTKKSFPEGKYSKLTGLEGFGSLMRWQKELSFNYYVPPKNQFP